MPLTFLVTAAAGAGITVLAKRYLGTEIGAEVAIHSPFRPGPPVQASFFADWSNYLAVGVPASVTAAAITSAVVYRAMEPSVGSQLERELAAVREALNFDDIPEGPAVDDADEGAQGEFDVSADKLKVQIRALKGQLNDERALRKLAAIQAALENFKEAARLSREGTVLNSPYKGAVSKIEAMQRDVDALRTEITGL